MVVSATGCHVAPSPVFPDSSSIPPKWIILLWVGSRWTILVVCQYLPFRVSGSMTCRLNTNIATPWIIIVHALFYSHRVLHYICTYMCVWYTLHCLQSIQSSLPQHYSVHSTTMVNEYLCACIGGPFLHSSPIFNLLWSFQLAHSTLKTMQTHLCRVWQFQTVRQNWRLPCGETQGGHSMVTVHSVMLWPIHRHQCFGVGKSFHKEPNWHKLLLSHALYICGHTESKISKQTSGYECRE